MDRKGVALAVADHVRSNKLDNLGKGHVKFLAASMAGLGGLDPQEVDEWLDVYHSLRDHLLVELYDPAFCQDVLSVLHVFLTDPATSAVVQELFLADEGSGEVAPLYGVLGLVFPEGDVSCQKAITSFLGELTALDDTDYPVLVQQLLDRFANFEGEKFRGTLLEVPLLPLCAPPISSCFPMYSVRSNDASSINPMFLTSGSFL